MNTDMSARAQEISPPSSLDDARAAINHLLRDADVTHCVAAALEIVGEAGGFARVIAWRGDAERLGGETVWTRGERAGRASVGPAPDRLSQRLARKACALGRAEWVPSRQALPGDSRADIGTRARDGVLAVPIVGRSGVHGALELVCRAGHVPDDELRRWLDEVADRLAAQFEQTPSASALALRREPERDDLTGLGTRALLLRELERAVVAAADGELRAALIHLDLDGFRQLNHDRGLDAGDELLRQVAARLRSGLHEAETLVRQGVDEFLLLVPGLPAPAATPAALARAERLRLAVARPFALDGREVVVRASVGVSLLGGDAGTPEDALRHADTAMSRAKRAARGGARLYRVTGCADGGPDDAGGRERDVALARERAQALDRVLAEGGLRTIYQPIVDLASTEVVAYEALIRGPADSPVAMPDALFPTARAAGRLGELDWACRAAAITGALAGGLARGCRLFLNVEPDALALPCPDALRQAWGPDADRLDIVVEITERALTARPADLLRLVREVRARGWGVALDDVGADVRALSVMPLLRPDIVKLDLRIIQEQPSTEIAEIIQAVAAESERTGALVLAEGIEHAEHAALARAVGATLGQGWHFGRPAELGRTATPQRPIVIAEDEPVGEDCSPYVAVTRHRPARRGDKGVLLALSLLLEQQAEAQGEAALIVSAFQDVGRFTPLTARRYARLARNAAFVAALGVGMPAEPVAGVRGADLGPDDVLRDEWSVAVLGPHFSAALVAVDLGDAGEDLGRRFDYAVTYDRELVVEAARTLVGRVQPLVAGPRAPGPSARVRRVDTTPHRGRRPHAAAHPPISAGPETV